MKLNYNFAIQLKKKKIVKQKFIIRHQNMKHNKSKR
jgi:hypothetical protein